MAHLSEPSIHNVRAVHARCYADDPVALDIDLFGPEPSYYGDGRATVSLFFPPTDQARALVRALAAAINRAAIEVGELTDEEGMS